MAAARAVASGRRLRADPGGDPLPSWNDGATKKSITDFVARVTTEGGTDFVPAAERIATFDNDGTLWCEQPIYFQVAFAIDRVKALAPKHPEWKEKEPFKALLDGDMKAVAAAGEKGLLAFIAATHAGMSVDDFHADRARLDRRPRAIRASSGPTPSLVYQPMLELLDVSARQRLQDLHRVRRRHRVHAAVDREGLRHSARAGGRLVRRDEVRDGRTASRC